MTHEPQYIWQHPSWPNFRKDSEALIKPLGECRFKQGSLLAQMRELGMEVRQQARAEVLIEEALKTSEIEGEKLDPKAVRSSVARRLGLPTAGLPEIRDRHADGVVEILLDATRNHDKPLTAERLFGWHAALFPTGYSGLQKIRVAAWRDDLDGPMQVVSGPVGREKVHYEAPPAKRVPREMERFLHWWEESSQKEDGLLRAAVAHLWFVAIHPFDDGNGRIARALTEMALAQDEALAIRYYSLSSQIMADSASYYSVLERTNKGDGEITGWLLWFLDCMSRAILRSNELLTNVLVKARFWQRHVQTELNDRQRKVINRLLEAGPDGFVGGMTNRKYAGMTHVSRATAQRELADLVNKGILRQNQQRGRNVSYSLVWEDSVHL
ncbi:Fic family protein [Geothermobacter ehrlichii]|uniref:Fic family protein n=1 Tax=Geothermobacter ehrlichii TaxID=213224 RepID=A0A5D3WFS0_9BACT|nr:Fic family protein [Geothermobacter ehrlichii]TYO96737.1 Fic family protein [Geothermobacter ehrlichii]